MTDEERHRTFHNGHRHTLLNATVGGGKNDNSVGSLPEQRSPSNGRCSV